MSVSKEEKKYEREILEAEQKGAEAERKRILDIALIISDSMGKLDYGKLYRKLEALKGKQTMKKQVSEKSLLKQFWSWLTNPYHGLQEKQIRALESLNRSYQEQTQRLNSNMATAQMENQQIDFSAFAMLRREYDEAFAYMSWKIRNYPNEIREDGTFKTVYYKNNIPSRME